MRKSKFIFLLACVFAVFSLTACEFDLPDVPGLPDKIEIPEIEMPGFIKDIIGDDSADDNNDDGNEDVPHTHEYTWTIKQDVKCNVDGIELGTCECGETTTREIKAEGHKFVVDAAVEPSHTATGLTEGKHCEVCGFVEVMQEVIPESHEEVVDAAVEATCTTTGLTEGKHCSVCEKVLVAQEVVPAKGHTYETVYENGYKLSKCNCGVEESKEAWLTHTVTQNISNVEIVKGEGTYTITFTAAKGWSGLHLFYNGAELTPDNVEEGYEVYPNDCSQGVYWSNGSWFVYSAEEMSYTVIYTVEGSVLAQPEPEVVPGFSYKVVQNIANVVGVEENGVVTITFTATGVWCGVHLYYDSIELTADNVVEGEGVSPVFSGCIYWDGDTLSWFLQNTTGADANYTLIYTLADQTLAQPHNFGEFVAEVAATCSEAGTKAHYECSLCNKYFDAEFNEMDSIEIPALGHTPAEAVKENEVAATCTASGSYDSVVYCSVCDAEISREQKEVAALGHTKEEIPVVAATCTKTGLTAGIKCSVCGEILVAQQEVPMIEHDITDSYYEVQDGVMMFVEVCSRGHNVSSELDVTNPIAVSNKNDLATILAAGYDVVLTADIDLTPAEDADITGLVISKNLTIDLANFKLTYNVADADSLNQVQISALTVDGGNVVMKNGTVESLSFGLFLNNGSLTLEEMTVKAATTAVQVNEGTLDILSGNYSVENAANDHNYTINCVDDSYIAGTAIVNIKGGKFENFNPANNLAEGENTNFVPAGYELTSKDNTYVVIKAAIARFTFENGIVNEGTDSNIRGTLLSNVTDTRYTEVNDSSYLITDKFSSTVIKGSHSGSDNSFGVKGINTGTGDFTISVKYAVQGTWENLYNKKNQFYVMGTGSETISGQKPAKPCFSITLGKDSKTAGFARATVTLNGETKDLFVSNAAGYFKSNTFVEFRIVKQGTKVTVAIICPPVEGQAKCSPYSVNYELSSPEDLMITADQVLGFGCNYGANRPGNYSYYDDICVYDYAVSFLD